MSLVDRHAAYLDATRPRPVSTRTRNAYTALHAAIATDGQTIARAYGCGGWLPSVKDNPYESLADLQAAALDAREGYGVVFVSDANHNGAFLGAEGANLLFRAHHDALHALENLEFHFMDECKVARRTVGLLHLGIDAAAVVAGEIIGQGLHYDRTGSFPLVDGGTRQPTFHVTNQSTRWAYDCFSAFTSEIF